MFANEAVRAAMMALGITQVALLVAKDVPIELLNDIHKATTHNYCTS